MSRIRIDGSGIALRANGGRILIGRNRECDVRFGADRDMVSSRHAELVLIDGRWILTDLGSTNGTWVGGRRLERPLALSKSTAVQIGREGPVIRVTLSSRRGTPAVFLLFLAVFLPPLFLATPEAARDMLDVAFPARSPDDSGSESTGTTLRKRDRAATREELRQNPLAAPETPRRWVAEELTVYAVDGADPLTAARSFEGDPFSMPSPLIRQGGHLFLGVTIRGTERPLVVEWSENGIALAETADVVAVGTSPGTCVLLPTVASRRQARGSAFACIVRHPVEYPNGLGHPPQRRASGPGRLEHRPVPPRKVPDDARLFAAVDLSGEPEEVVVAAWKEMAQSLKTIEIEGRPVPLFATFADRPDLVAGRVTLERRIEAPALDLPGLRIESPELPAGRPLPALGGEGRFLVVGGQP